MANDDSNNKAQSTDNSNDLYMGDSRLQTQEEHESDKNVHPSKQQKVTPLSPDTKTETLGDKITVNSENEDILTPVKDDNDTKS